MSEGHQKVTINVSTAALIKVVLIALLLVALYMVRDIVLMMIVAMILASAMDPLVDWLYRKARFPRGLSVILVYLVFLSIIGLVFYFLIPPMIHQFGELAGRFSDLKAGLDDEASAINRLLNEMGITKGLSALGESFAKFTGQFFATTLGVVNGIIQLIAVLAITFYLISSENGMKSLIKSLVPFKHQAYSMRLTDQIQRKIGYWLLGQLLLSTFIFILTFIGLSVLGVKSAIALALLAGILEIVPYLGPVLSAVPAIFVAFIQSPPLALFVIGLYIIIQQVENYILVPKVMGRTVGANPVIILLAVLIGFQIAGIVGMLVSVPIVAATSVFINDLRESKDA